MSNRLETLIDNAYYCCKPELRRGGKTRNVPPMKLYIHKLLYEDLNEQNVRDILKKVRSLKWDEDEQVILAALTKVYRCKYAAIPAMAQLLMQLGTYQPFVPIVVADSILEEFLAGLYDEFVDHQRMISFMRMIGELYVAKLIDHPVVFDLLYTIVWPAVEIMQSPADMASDRSFDFTFRIRLGCVLLQTCGRYFTHNTIRDKLDTFLVFFQFLVFLEMGTMSFDLEFLLDDVLNDLKPRSKRPRTLEEARNALEKLMPAAVHPVSSFPPLGYTHYSMRLSFATLFTQAPKILSRNQNLSMSKLLWRNHPLNPKFHHHHAKKRRTPLTRSSLR